jgi:hypothetical protein
VKITKNLGMLLLAIFLILWGLIAIADIGSVTVTTIMDILAIAAGVLILIGR